MHKAVQGQYPEAFILAFMDSRVPVEEIFDAGIGDLFVGRLAGNIIDEDILASIEYGCKLAGAKLIVVLGHESCGAVKTAIEKEKLGSVTTLLAKIQLAIHASMNVAGEHNTENHDFVAAVVQNNIPIPSIPSDLKARYLKKWMTTARSELSEPTTACIPEK